MLVVGWVFLEEKLFASGREFKTLLMWGGKEGLGGIKQGASGSRGREDWKNAESTGKNLKPTCL